MLFRETVVYCENCMEHTLSGKNSEYVKTRGTYTNHEALKG
jgi:hypothetical protein